MAENAYSFRNLILWQKAQEFTLAVVKLVAALPNDRVAPVLARQIVRAASSISANIAEGHGRFTLAAHRNHLSIAKGSACEADGWLDLLRRAGYLNEAEEHRLHEHCQELIRMLTAKILDMQRQERSSGKRIGQEPAEYVVEAPVEVDRPGSGF
jgi:four helix bundle protein